MLLYILIAAIIGIVLFVNFSKQFGGSHSKEDIIRYQQSGHYREGAFQNAVPTTVSADMGWKAIIETTIAFIKGNPNGKPKSAIPVNLVDSLDIEKNKRPRLIWFGHSAILLQIDGLSILLDPMLGKVPAPHPYFGSKRYSDHLPIEIERLPAIDAIIISHDHYDHLDYGSIEKLKGKTNKFYVPLGVGAHLKEWGVKEQAIHELNWWDEISHKTLQLAFAPARHFSGRGLNDRSSTLWGSWIIKGEEQNVYFSGDGGYGAHFKEIGEKYGPFDFAMLECGQYNERWSLIHMMPEETVQAAIDVNAKVMMPIHWGAFTLALHDWNDPAIRVTKTANKLNIPITVPEIGAEIRLDSLVLASNPWWN